MLIDLEDMICGYTECAFWSSMNDNGHDAEGNLIEDEGEYMSESSANPSESLQRVFDEDCLKFYEANKDLIALAIESTGHSEARLGHDFWLTRNHHGAGFWDGSWGEFGDALDAACEAFGDCELYTGDDNLIYVSGREN